MICRISGLGTVTPPASPWKRMVGRRLALYKIYKSGPFFRGHVLMFEGDVNRGRWSPCTPCNPDPQGCMILPLDEVQREGRVGWITLGSHLKWNNASEVKYADREIRQVLVTTTQKNDLAPGTLGVEDEFPFGKLSGRCYVNFLGSVINLASKKNVGGICGFISV